MEKPETTQTYDNSEYLELNLRLPYMVEDYIELTKGEETEQHQPATDNH